MNSAPVTYTVELSAGLKTWLNNSNHKVLIHLLDRIEALGKRNYIPALDSWSQSVGKKFRRKIHGVVERINKKQCL